jgi:hypothetical protein
MLSYLVQVVVVVVDVVVDIDNQGKDGHHEWDIVKGILTTYIQHFLFGFKMKTWLISNVRVSFYRWYYSAKWGWSLGKGRFL